jgi:hypothetical protein
VWSRVSHSNMCCRAAAGSDSGCASSQLLTVNTVESRLPCVTIRSTPGTAAAAIATVRRIGRDLPLASEAGLRLRK